MGSNRFHLFDRGIPTRGAQYYQKIFKWRKFFIQYEKPEKGRQYVITADVARGKGLDYSTFNVFDISEMPYKQVAVFRDNFIGPIDFASVLNRIGLVYNKAGILVEINDIGGQVTDVLLMDYG